MRGVNLKLSGARLWDSLMEMARIGGMAKGGGGGVGREDLLFLKKKKQKDFSLFAHGARLVAGTRG